MKNEATGFEISSYTGCWRRSSGAFRDMVRAANNAAKVQKRLSAAFAQDRDRQKLLRDNQAVQAEKRLSASSKEDEILLQDNLNRAARKEAEGRLLQ